MGKIQHCKVARKAVSHWCLSDREEFKWIQIHVLDRCPNCKQRVIEFNYLDWSNRKTPQHRTKATEHTGWLAYIEHYEEQKDETAKKRKNEKVSKTPPFVSEWTLRACKAVERVYWKMLRKSKRAD